MAPPRVLIFGGSQGSHAINVAMVEAAPLLAEGRRAGSQDDTAEGRSPEADDRVNPGDGEAPGARLRMAITHQTGENDLEFVRDAYRRAGLDARVEPFLFAMDREMKGADLVVSRAGATTLSELTAAGKPAVLVPLPTAADDHQRKNADVLQAAGAAVVLDQKDLTGATLATTIEALIEDPERLRAMSEAARRLARPDAARVIVDRALALIEG
jgi:UDP-N-acetylglucosamine--N-acetylmuramyl-(pentapeptide) pyrophosphoryl-undecaprenol N-acetylglucosamine transferase